MDWFFYGLQYIFESIFSLMPPIGSWFNKLLITIGFIAFFIWVGYMLRQKETESFD